MSESERVYRKSDLVLRRFSAYGRRRSISSAHTKSDARRNARRFAERIGRQLFKIAVEQNVNNHILASDTDIDAAHYMKMRALSIEQVKATNGKIAFADVLRQEKSL